MNYIREHFAHLDAIIEQRNKRIADLEEQMRKEYKEHMIALYDQKWETRLREHRIEDLEAELSRAMRTIESYGVAS